MWKYFLYQYRLLNRYQGLDKFVWQLFDFSKCVAICPGIAGVLNTPVRFTALQTLCIPYNKAVLVKFG